MLEFKTILQPLLLRHRAQRAMRRVSARLRRTPSTVAETGEPTINAYQDKAKCDVDQSLVPSLLSSSHRSTPDQDYFHFFHSESVASAFNLVGLLVSPAPTKITFTATAAAVGV